MNFLVNLFSEMWVQRLGWVLIHFLWEGTVIALLLAVLLRLLAKASSDTRYAVTGVAFLFCAIAPIFTWMMLAPHKEGYQYTAAIGVPNLAQSGNQVGSPPISRLSPALAAPADRGMPLDEMLAQGVAVSLPYIVGLWFIGVVGLSARLSLGWVWMERLCRSGIPVTDPHCLAKFQSLLIRMQISRPVRLLESALVEVPMLIGWMRPTILVPVSLFVGLTPDQIQAVFAHELAHIKRYDFIINLLQTIIETVLFYHPAIWWISWQLREERENCCDDIALDVMQDRLIYISALTLLEEARVMPLALSVSGGTLLQRISRIVGAKDRKASAWPLWVLIIGTLCFVVLFAVQYGSHKLTWNQCSEIPGDGTTALASTPIAYSGKLYLFAVGQENHRHYVKTFNGEIWSGWDEVPGGGTTLLSDTAVTYKDKLYLFAIGGEDHQHYVNVLDRTNWSGWSLVPGFGTTLLPDSAVSYKGKLYLFAIGGGDHQHYVTSFDGNNWNCWSLVPGFGTALLPDSAVAYGDRLYLFAIGGGDHKHYVMSFDGTNWNGWSQVPGSGTTLFSDSTAVYRGKLYLFAVGGDENYLTCFDGNKWSGWELVPNSAVTGTPNSVAVFRDELHLFSVGGTDHKHYQNVFGPNSVPLANAGKSKLTQPQAAVMSSPNNTQ
jgi:beta-lactamase regulating signal transducer with metallopeptidase domain